VVRPSSRLRRAIDVVRATTGARAARPHTPSVPADVDPGCHREHPDTTFSDLPPLDSASHRMVRLSTVP